MTNKEKKEIKKEFEKRNIYKLEWYSKIKNTWVKFDSKTFLDGLLKSGYEVRINPYYCSK